MSLKKAAAQIYRSAATQGPEAKPQASTPSYSVRISSLAENLARDHTTNALTIRGTEQRPAAPAAK